MKKILSASTIICLYIFMGCNSSTEQSQTAGTQTDPVENQVG